MRYLRVKNWEEFQHYKDRNPPWIKFHRALLDDFEFCALPDDTKAHLVLIWLLASQNSGRIPEDPAFLASKIGAKKRPRLDELIRAGFLIPEQDASSGASTMQATRKHDASESLDLARSREKRTRTTDKATEAEESRAGARRPRKTPIPDDFAISDRVRQWAADKGHERLDEHLASFVSKAKAKGYTYVDWDEAFMNAIRDNWARLSARSGLSAVGQRTAENLTGWLNDGTRGP